VRCGSVALDDLATVNRLVQGRYGPAGPPPARRATKPKFDVPPAKDVPLSPFAPSPLLPSNPSR
jgi:hypothetical protein